MVDEGNNGADAKGVSGELARHLFDSTADGVYAVDEQRRIIAMNPAALRTLGRRLEDVLGLPCHEVLRLNICRESCALRAARDSGRSIVNLPVEIQHEDNRRTPAILSSAVVTGDNGRDVAGVETFRDLSSATQIPPHLVRFTSDSGILTADPGMRELLEMLPTLAPSESSLLLTGETGTGKSLVARAIHSLSDRHDAPFVTVNCAALPESLLESELFGYKAGAFTGATRDREGRIAAADGGTLFLDEIGDVPVAMQVKLLRFLQDHSYERLGDTATRQANVRIVAATNRDLAVLMAEGRFREDLYYRINVVNLQMPALRERLGDVPLLTERFLENFSNRRGKQVTGVSAEVMRRLESFRYPGNVRELENIIEHAYVLCPGPTVEVEHLPLRLRRAPDGRGRAKSFDDVQGKFLLEVLARHDWNRMATAKELGIHRTTLQRRIRRLGLRVPKRDGRHRPPDEGGDA